MIVKPGNSNISRVGFAAKTRCDSHPATIRTAVFLVAVHDTTDKMQAIADAFEELLRTIAGYTSSGIEGTVMEVLLEPLFDEAGWEKRILNVTCPDAYFVEYSYEDFKMMFVKSTRPRNDYMNNCYHNIEVTFTYEGPYGAGGSYYVGGNKYRMIQFKDNENVSYRKVVKAKSIRK